MKTKTKRIKTKRESKEGINTIKKLKLYFKKFKKLFYDNKVLELFVNNSFY